MAYHTDEIRGRDDTPEMPRDARGVPASRAETMDRDEPMAARSTEDGRDLPGNAVEPHENPNTPPAKVTKEDVSFASSAASLMGMLL